MRDRTKNIEKYRGKEKTKEGKEGCYSLTLFVYIRNDLWAYRHLLRKKLFPNYREPPAAMKDSYGNIITSLSDIEQLSIETCRNRLKNRPIIPELESLKKQKI